MWWGTTIEAPDPSALARFYAELLGWHIGREGREQPSSPLHRKDRSSCSSRRTATWLRSGHLAEWRLDSSPGGIT
ncbi:VOC family protein [Kitasatospora sp. NBC_00070]|uniref:VOC family protein n=1 Tax=Kitasatospora sp. NBC_00070 TaxID=2975962 RepID=UPI0038601D50